MSKLFEHIPHKIIIVEQNDLGDGFNIGKLKNIGFEIATENPDYKDIEFSHFVFTDIDHVPDSALFNYYLCAPRHRYPVGLAALGTRWQDKYKYNEVMKGDRKPFLGGVCSFTARMFKEVDGYPNNYYGWGGEDDDLLLRCHKARYAIAYPKHGSVLDLEQVDNKTMTTKEKNDYLKENELGDKRRYEKILQFDEIAKNGLSNLQFEIIKSEKSVSGFSHCNQYKVDLLKSKDMKDFESWFPKVKVHESTEAEKAYNEKINEEFKRFFKTFKFNMTTVDSNME